MEVRSVQHQVRKVAPGQTQISPRHRIGWIVAPRSSQRRSVRRCPSPPGSRIAVPSPRRRRPDRPSDRRRTQGTLPNPIWLLSRRRSSALDSARHPSGQRLLATQNCRWEGLLSGTEPERLLPGTEPTRKNDPLRTFSCLLTSGLCLTSATAFCCGLGYRLSHLARVGIADLADSSRPDRRRHARKGGGASPASRTGKACLWLVIVVVPVVASIIPTVASVVVLIAVAAVVATLVAALVSSVHDRV